MWNTSDYTLYFDRNPFYRHEQIILSMGNYDGYLPMSFLRSSHGLTVRYESGGYLPLSNYRIERTEDVLYLMERTVQILHCSPEYLLAPERIVLNTDTVFYSRAQDDLRIAFLPRAADEKRPSAPSNGSGGIIVPPFHQGLILFLAQLKHDVRDPHISFLLRLAKDLYYNHPATSAMLRLIGLLRRELDALTRPAAT